MRLRPRVVVAVALALGLVAGGCSGGAGSDGRAEEGGPADRDVGSSLVATVEDQGSFSTPCGYSHSSADDPIVHAEHAGASHRHDFFGATRTSALSSADSLLVGATTCRSVADRSAYWTPALLDGGRPVTPDGVLAYYRVPVGADAARVEAPPNGLEMIAGDAAALEPQDAGVVAWHCGFAPEASPVPQRCGDGMDLRLVLTFDPCWNGTALRSADHRSHLAPLGDDGVCPGSHPVLLPELTLEVRYRLDAPSSADPAAGAELALASGPPTGGHGDALLAWDEDHIAREVELCLRANRRCDVVSETSRLDFDRLG